MLSASAQPGTTSEHRRQAARAPRLPLMAIDTTAANAATQSLGNTDAGVLKK
jgi:hypothetical protein